MGWKVTIDGPESTPYEGGKFVLQINFGAQYPFKAPIVKFLTKIYHPNVKGDTGEICNAIIADDWGPTLNVRHCVEVMKTMIEAPDVDNPFNEEVAKQLRDDPKEFEKAAIKCTKDHAMG